MNPIWFIKEVRQFGWKVAKVNWLILFTKWYTKADRIRLEWDNEDLPEEGVIKSKQTPKE